MSFSVSAQQGAVRLLTFGGYTFADKVDFSNGYGKISDGFQWGAGVEIGISPVNAFELIYQRMDAEGMVVPFFGDREEADLGITYVMIGGTRYVPVSDLIRGFASFDAGLAVFTPKDLDRSNVTKFAWGLRAGMEVSPGDLASLRIHAQLMSPVQAVGGGFYLGTGGSGAGVSTYSTIYQFNLGGSLIFRLK